MSATGVAPTLVAICDGLFVLRVVFVLAVKIFCSSGGLGVAGMFRSVGEALPTARSWAETFWGEGSVRGAGSLGLLGNNSSRRASAVELAPAGPRPPGPAG